MATNRTVGNKFEQEFCEFLCRKGFWTHRMGQKAEGQPADVIAVRNRNAYLIDCKVCSRNKFPMERVEENQHFSMEFWSRCGNGEGWFALKVENEVYMIPHVTMIELSYKKATLNLNDIQQYGVLLGRWLQVCG